jgi:carbamoyl-phosphate synthase large subunit
VFPFARFPGVDLLLGPEMKSTGEVMGLDRDFGAAFAKSQLAAGNQLPDRGTVFISVRDRDKPAMVALGRRLLERGYQLIATRGTALHLRAAGLEVELVNKVFEGRPHIVDRIKDGQIVMVLNTTEGERAIRDSYTLRRAALMHKVPYYTTVAGARAVVQALVALAERELAVAPLQSYYSALG